MSRGSRDAAARRRRGRASVHGTVIAARPRALVTGPAGVSSARWKATPYKVVESGAAPETGPREWIVTAISVTGDDASAAGIAPPLGAAVPPPAARGAAAPCRRPFPTTTGIVSVTFPVCTVMSARPSALHLTSRTYAEC